MRVIRTLLAAQLLFAAPGLAQQASLPRAGHFSTGHIKAGSITYEVFRISPGPDTTPVHFATLTTSTRLVTDAGEKSVARVSVFQAGQRVIVDSMLTRIAGLTGVWEISHQPDKTMHLFFNGASVTGSVTKNDGSVDTVKATLAEPAFNSSDVDLLIASLPFKTGLRVAISNYVYEVPGGLVIDTVNVIGKEMLTSGGKTRKAWRVEDRDPNIIATYWIDPGSRVVLRGEFLFRSNGGRMRMVQTNG